MSPNGAWLAYVRGVETGGLAVRILDGRDGRECAHSDVFPEALWGARRMVVDDTGQFVAWTKRSGVHLWRVSEGAPRLFPSWAAERSVLAFDAVGHALELRVLGGDIGSRHLTIDVASGRVEDAPAFGALVAVALSIDGRRGAYGTLQGFGAIDFQPRASTPALGSTVSPGRTGRMDGDVRALACLDGLGVVVTGSGAHGTLELSGGDGRCLGRLDTGATGIRALHARPDGETLVFVGDDGALGTCRPRDGVVNRWPSPFVYANELALDARGARAFCVHGLVGGMRGKDYGRNLPRAKQDVSSVWDVEHGALVAVLDHIPQLGQSAAWLEDGSGRLRLRRGTAAHLLALPSGEMLDMASFPLDWDIHAPPPCLVPGGQAILTTLQDRIVVWDLEDEQPRATLCEARHAKILAFDPRGRHCVLRTPRGGAWVVRLADGVIVLRLAEPAGGEAVAAAAFGASGRTLALVLEGQTIRTVALGLD